MRNNKMLIQKKVPMEGFDTNMDLFENMLTSKGLTPEFATYLSIGLVALLILLLCIGINLILKRVVLRIITKIIKNNKFKWDDYLLDHKVMERIINIIPGFIIYMSAPIFTPVTVVIQKIAYTYIIITLFYIINAVSGTINDYYRTKPVSKVRPITGMLQVIKIILFIILIIVGVANLMGESPIILLSSIGALTAVFSFVFKDSILGFIAGIQLTSNDMLRIGDWIEMKKYNADGDVIDITLNTVKVQNFDKTIATIPAYALMSDSFQNWRGMVEFGGRRIKRSIYIDVNSIGFCTSEMLEKFRKIHYLKAYISEKEEELSEYNRTHEVDGELLINGRHMTNIGTFRAYITNYIMNHPDIDSGKVQMVRQLPPGEKGLPIEIYCFTSTVVWVEYERIQSDLFDHILSIVEEFGLQVFQNPSGNDLKKFI